MESDGDETIREVLNQIGAKKDAQTQTTSSSQWVPQGPPQPPPEHVTFASHPPPASAAHQQQQQQSWMLGTAKKLLLVFVVVFAMTLAPVQDAVAGAMYPMKSEPVKNALLALAAAATITFIVPALCS